jgi:hypothetical protein
VTDELIMAERIDVASFTAIPPPISESRCRQHCSLAGVRSPARAVGDGSLVLGNQGWGRDGGHQQSAVASEMGKTAVENDSRFVISVGDNSIMTAWRRSTIRAGIRRSEVSTTRHRFKRPGMSVVLRRKGERV